MSYILEALRKSEQERNPEKVPNLATHHRHVATEGKKHFPYWILGVLLILINGIVLFYFLSKEPDVTVKKIPLAIEKTTIEAEHTSKIIDQDVVVEAKTEAIIASKVEPETKVEPDVVKVIPEITAPKTILDSTSVPNISELTYDIQQQIPDMDFSTHIYVRDGGSFIIINGKSLSEGMLVERGLRLEKILSDGIILEFKNRRFFMTSMTSWVKN